MRPRLLAATATLGAARLLSACGSSPLDGKTGQEVAGRIHPFDDREVVRAVWAESRRAGTRPALLRLRRDAMQVIGENISAALADAETEDPIGALQAQILHHDAPAGDRASARAYSARWSNGDLEVVQIRGRRGARELQEVT